MFNNVNGLFFQRIAQITTTLQFSLEGSFRDGLENNDMLILRQCLRTYATIDKMRDAENLFRQYVVKPYMEEVGVVVRSIYRQYRVYSLIIIVFFHRYIDHHVTTTHSVLVYISFNRS